MTVPRVLGALLVGAALGAATVSCSDDRTPSGTFAERLCPGVTEWADASVHTVNVFQEGSPALEPPGRKAAYLVAFDELQAHLAEWEQALHETTFDVLDGDDVRDELLEAAARARDEYDGDIVEAEELPLDAYDQIQVSEGSLFTGLEKAKAIIFGAVGAVWRERGLVDENCGRRPPVSINLGPG